MAVGEALEYELHAARVAGRVARESVGCYPPLEKRAAHGCRQDERRLVPGLRAECELVEPACRIAEADPTETPAEAVQDVGLGAQPARIRPRHGVQPPVIYGELQLDLVGRAVLLQPHHSRGSPVAHAGLDEACPEQLVHFLHGRRPKLRRYGVGTLRYRLSVAGGDVDDHEVRELRRLRVA